MKVGVVYAPRPDWPKWEWVAKALLNLGHEIVRVTHADDLLSADAECDVLLFEHRDCGIGWRHVRDKAERRRAVWAQWWFDLMATQANVPLAEQHQFRLCGAAMRLFDHVLVKERDLLHEYASLGVNAHYLDQGCPSHYAACEHKPEPLWDVLVFGSADASYRERRKAAQLLAADGFAVAWATKEGQPPSGVEPVPWCHPDKLPALMSEARSVLCVDYRADVGGYTSDRNWLVAGSGALPLVKHPGCDIRDVAKLLHDMPFEKRKEFGAYLRKRVLGRHTYEHRLQSLFAILDRSRGRADGQASVPDVPWYEAGEDETERHVRPGAMSGV